MAGEAEMPEAIATESTRLDRVAFFGAAFIAGGFGIGLMFGIWVVTLHLPRVLGLYAIPGAPRDSNEWSSLLIAIALWGGSGALAPIGSGLARAGAATSG